jgi:GNAT superfamily N-acetyltransferase
MNAIMKPHPILHAQECVQDVMAEIEPLLRAHYLEIAHFQDIPLNPDFDRYVRAERAGALRIYTARRNTDLVGYAIYFVQPHLHYSGSLQAQQDVLYLTPETRKGGAGLWLIRYADQELASEGVQVVIQHVKARPDLNFGPLLERLGYELMDHLYVKRLD